VSSHQAQILDAEVVSLNMPRKKLIEEKERPKYLSADGTLNFNLIFKFPSSSKSFTKNCVQRNRYIYPPAAPQCLSTGAYVRVKHRMADVWCIALLFNV